MNLSPSLPWPSSLPGPTKIRHSGIWPSAGSSHGALHMSFISCFSSLHFRSRLRVARKASFGEMKTRELRRLLDAAGAQTAGCFDRESLLELLDDPKMLKRCEALSSKKVVEVPLHKVSWCFAPLANLFKEFQDLGLYSTSSRDPTRFIYILFYFH